MSDDGPIAFRINGGDCPECGAEQSLKISIIVEGDVLWGSVDCCKCCVWITDLMPDELVLYGIPVDDKYLCDD